MYCVEWRHIKIQCREKKRIVGRRTRGLSESGFRDIEFFLTILVVTLYIPASTDHTFLYESYGAYGAEKKIFEVRDSCSILCMQWPVA